MNNTIPVVFCFDKRIILGASTAIKSLIDCAKNSTTYDIHIFHSDIELREQKNITSLADNTRHNISFHYINPDIFKGAPCNKHSWTQLVYYRLLTPEILTNYDKVIYSDVDVLFKGDLSESYNINLDGYELAAVPMEKNVEGKMICHKYFCENKNDKIYISSYIIFDSKLMREEKTVEKFFDVIKNVGNRLKFFDLDTMNIACDKILPLGFEYSMFQSMLYDDIEKAPEYRFLKEIYTLDELEKAKKHPVVIHYAGAKGKPWRMKKPYDDYLKVMNSLPKSLKRKFTFRDFRKRLFSKH